MNENINRELQSLLLKRESEIVIASINLDDVFANLVNFVRAIVSRQEPLTMSGSTRWKQTLLALADAFNYLIVDHCWKGTQAAREISGRGWWS